MSDDAAHSRANAGASEATAQDVTGHAADYSARSCALLLLGHSSATSESQEGRQHSSSCKTRETIKVVHDSFLV